ncbi:MAG: hypothetical protein KY432_08635 [Acidobacteria bacterium]|nr:hypothetical protein [Acidobacteriota bacterium]
MSPIEEVETPDRKTIEDVSGFLGVAPSQVAKSLLIQTDKEVVMILLPGHRAANETKIKNALEAEWIQMADEETIRRVTGGPEGFSGPLGVETLRIFADVSLRGMRNFIVGANKADVHLKNVNLGRDFTPTSFGDFTVVTAGDPCPRCRTELQMYRGIEVGHIFKLGTKYSTAMGCDFLDEGGERHPMIMGCYGLGIGRTIAAAIEQGHDDDGIIWPVSIAPFEALVTAVGREDEVHETAASIYAELRENGIDVLLDDRDERPGVKFKDADLLGIPLRVTVGKKSLADGNVELSTRREKEKTLVTPADAIERIVDAVSEAKR